MKVKRISILAVILFLVTMAAGAQSCVYCKGTRKIIKEVPISTYGNDVKVWCDICKKSFWRSHGHMHVTCQHCRGTGRSSNSSSSSPSSSNNGGKPSDDFLSTNLTYDEMEQLKFWSKCLYTGYPYEGECKSCNGKKTCNWCNGTGYIRAGYGGHSVQVACKCLNGICTNCAGLGKYLQYSKDPADMKIVQDKINEIYEIAKRRSGQYSHQEPTTQTQTQTSSSRNYDFACQRYLTGSDLYGLSKRELRIMRNWIFARHGYIFKTADMKSFFSKQPWYKGRYSDVSSMFSEIEKYNIRLIKSYE